MSACLNDVDRISLWAMGSDNTVDSCAACSSRAHGYYVEMSDSFSVFLCSAHLHAFLGRYLDSRAVSHLKAHLRATENALLSSHYYDPSTGSTLAPRAMNLEGLNRVVRQLIPLPEEPPPEMIILLNEELQAATGTTVLLQTAALMAKHALESERMRRASELFPDAARRDSIRGQLLLILQDEDLQGLMSLELEQVPYIREAVYLSRHVDGSSTETPTGILQILLQVFGEAPEPSVFERYSALARAISVEVCAPLAIERTQRHLQPGDLTGKSHRLGPEKQTTPSSLRALPAPPEQPELEPL